MVHFDKNVFFLSKENPTDQHLLRNLVFFHRPPKIMGQSLGPTNLTIQYHRDVGGFGRNKAQIFRFTVLRCFRVWDSFNRSFFGPLVQKQNPMEKEYWTTCQTLAAVNPCVRFSRVKGLPLRCTPYHQLYYLIEFRCQEENIFVRTK